MSTNHLAVAALLVVTPVFAQTTNDPFPEPIEASEGVVVVGFEEFASLPDIEGSPARPMLLVDEPGTGRLFVNDMRGPLYSVTYDGRVTLYLDIDESQWDVPVESSGRERGFQSFALHPHFNEPGTAGYGKLYTWTDTEDTGPLPDFVSGGGQDAHDTVLLEWTAHDPEASAYDGGSVGVPPGRHRSFVRADVVGHARRSRGLEARSTIEAPNRSNRARRPE